MTSLTICVAPHFLISFECDVFCKVNILAAEDAEGFMLINSASSAPLRLNEFHFFFNKGAK